jgi:hypothetical protein
MSYMSKDTRDRFWRAKKEPETISEEMFGAGTGWSVYPNSLTAFVCASDNEMWTRVKATGQYV